MTGTVNLAGQIFGELTVVRLVGRNKHKHYAWDCQCKCGKTVVVTSGHLRSGHTRSCGCLRDRATASRSIRHGKARRGAATGEYRSWQCMIRRCCNQNDPKFKDYGGRGITVCEQWRASFETFFEDMGDQSGTANTIERIDVNGNYEPSNCRWAASDEQAINKRSNVRITAEGVTLCIAEWSRKLGIPADRIRGRLRLGWPPELALTVQKYGKAL